MDGDGWGGELKCYIHTYRQTDIQTYRHTDRASDEAGPRGAFAPNKLSLLFLAKQGVSLFYVYFFYQITQKNLILIKKSNCLLSYPFQNQCENQKRTFFSSHHRLGYLGGRALPKNYA